MFKFIQLIFFIYLFNEYLCNYPSSYCIRFDTNIRNEKKFFILNITQSWAPIGSNHLFNLINSQFYQIPSAFFRVVPQFVLQFGISGNPRQNQLWNQTILDDPVLISNSIATLSYATAGPNTRTTQLFINYVNNTRLDSLGFAPLGIVSSGFETAKNVFNPTPGSSDGVDQEQYSKKGNKWIIENYPQINFIEKASITFNCPVSKDLIHRIN